MRSVAKFQFASASNEVQASEAVVRVIETWGERKFRKDAFSNIVNRFDGRQALFDRNDERCGEAQQVTFLCIEPVSGGQLQTQVRVLSDKKGMHFQCNLSLGTDGELQTPQVEIRSPRFIRDVVDLRFGWRVGNEGENVFAKCFDIDHEDVNDLEALMDARHRRLPIILVSELEGETIAGDLHERLSADACGLAHTCRISRAASWELTEKRGREWSCYNGAVRLFWPFRKNEEDYRSHPLWTYDNLMRRADTQVSARDRFRRDLVELLIEASTFVADDAAFSHFETERLRQASEASRATASEIGDFEHLAALYAKENDELRGRLDDKAREIENLQQYIEILTISSRAGQVVTQSQIEQFPSPLSVLEALNFARREYAAFLMFSTDVDAQVLTLNQTAGPPDKLLRYFRTLRELSEALDAVVSLGKSVPIWLREKGVECSGESETVKGSKEAKKRRTFNINDKETYCEFHAKPSDGVHPDLCIRIYFAVCNEAPRLRIGYVGRHFD